MLPHCTDLQTDGGRGQGTGQGGGLNGPREGIYTLTLCMKSEIHKSFCYKSTNF